MSEINLLIADDQKLFAESLKMILTVRCKDFKEIWIANNGKDAIDIALEKKPDIILMDIFMPIINGVEATKVIRNKLSKTQIIILTTFSADEYVLEALLNGAAGYLFKDISPEELINAIKTVKEGSVLIPQKIAKKLLEQIQPEGREAVPKAAAAKHNESLDILSKREKEVLDYISQGLDNSEIAEVMFLSEQTVKNYVSSIYSKIGAHNRMRAMQIGLNAKNKKPLQ